MSNLSGLRSKLTFSNPFVLLLCGAVIGRMAWSGHTAALPLSLLTFALIRPARTMRNRWLLFAAYYAGATWPIVPGSAVFYGHAFNPFAIVSLWLAVAAVLASPFAILTSGKSNLRLAWSIPASLIIAALPPFAMFGLANPLVAAGAMFPATKLFGLVLLLALAALVAIRPAPMLFLAASATIATTFVPSPPPPPGWRAINTTFSGAGVDAPDALTQYRVAQSIQQTAIATDAKVVIFPESVVYQWSPVTDLFWQETIQRLRHDGKTIVVGAIMQLSGRDRYMNVAVVRGDTTNAMQQRIPMPVSLWKPLTNRGVPLNLYGPGTLTIHGQRATILICYEQLLVWPMVRSASEHPTVLVGIANEYWAKQTNAGPIQDSSLQAWGQLFHIPVISAVNQ
jgi:hypothetical protein